MDKYIFLRIAWMKEYRGVTEDDIPAGAGSYVEENDDGGEVYNFYPVNGKVYGYARVQSAKSIRIERLGVNKHDEKIDNITIVFFAKNKLLGGQYVVGYYKNATLYRNVQRVSKNLRNGYVWYNCITDQKNAVLIEPQQRTNAIFQIPEDGPGQSNVWYVQEYHNSGFLEKIKKFIANPRINNKTPIKTIKQPWQPDIEKRKRVEWVAMETVENHFIQLGFEVVYRQTENLGWDLEATLAKTKLLLEVKGLSNEFGTIELTANEYAHAKKFKKQYRICVVSNALSDEKRKLEIFYYQDNEWINDKNEILQVVRIESAKFIKS